LHRAIAFGAMRRFGSRLRVKLKPRNFPSSGLATALFCCFTLSLSRWVMNRLTLSLTRCPARSLRT
jgi:hypothetical protein